MGAAIGKGFVAVTSVRDLIRRRQTRANEVPMMPSGNLMARVRPETVLVEEKYTVRQEISRNPDIALEAGSCGTIKVEVP